MPLNFAYGSNMDAQAMASRCPGARFLGRAALPRFAFALMPDGYATVQRDPHAMTQGVLWDLSFGDLDRYEGVAQGAYDKLSLPVLREKGASVRALIYIGRPGKVLGRAPADYMQKIILSAEAYEFEKDYVSSLRRVAGEEPQSAGKFRAIKNLKSL
jgi:hypothetical protein